MPKDSIRKKCVECRRVFGGRKGKPQWCDQCGGEMREIPYGPRTRARARHG